MKKLGPILLLTLITGLIWCGVVIKMKSTTIDVQAQEIEKATLVDDVVTRIYEDHETIRLLREKKMLDCEALGLDIPLKLIEDGICPVPSM